MNEMKQVLKNIAWRRVRECWREEARGRPKMEVIGRLMDCECKKRCVDIGCKRQRRILVKLSGGMAELRIETSRWCRVSRDERISKKCGADGTS